MIAPRIWITADVHHGIDHDEVGLTQLLVDQLRALAGPDDLVLLAGDLGGIDGDGLEACLAAFADIGGARAFVPGNHDLWVRRDADLDSLQRYRETLPRIGQRYGYQMLDEQPLRLPIEQGVLAIAGCYGGYDFSLANLAHISHGADEIQQGWRDGRYAGMRWNDYKYCLRTENQARILLEPAAFCEEMVQRFDAQLHELEHDREVRAIVAVTHTASHREQVEGHPLKWGRPTSTVEWFNGVAGSARLGDAIRKASKVRLSICGHTHHQRQHTDESGRLWVNCGSTYQRKCWYSWSLSEGLTHHGWLPEKQPESVSA